MLSWAKLFFLPLGKKEIRNWTANYWDKKSAGSIRKNAELIGLVQILLAKPGHLVNASSEKLIILVRMTAVPHSCLTMHSLTMHSQSSCNSKKICQHNLLFLSFSNVGQT